jgi:ribosomal-protein-alanine N-acetyltransferase
MNYYLKVNRIYLREVRETDVNEHYYSWLNNPDVNQYLETRFIPRSIENILEYVRAKKDRLEEPFFAVCLLDNHQHIGNIKLGPINWLHRNADVSLFIGEKELWGQGYATEAIALLAEYAFHTLVLNKLKAGVYAENKASIQAFEKCGFYREGILKGQVFYRGREMDVILFGLRAVDYWKEGFKE